MQDADELITIKHACLILGGEEKPISAATYYRGVQAGRFPAPVHPAPKVSRLSKAAVLDARAKIIAGSGRDR